MEEKLSNLYDIGCKLLNNSSCPTTFRTFYLESIIRKAIGMAETLRMLIRVRDSSLEYVKEDMTITSIARNMIDLCRMTNYFIEPGISTEERAFREKTWSYHSSKTLFNITDKLNDYDLDYQNLFGSRRLFYYQQDLTENVVLKHLIKVIEKRF